jgi:hypothetical protein
MLSSSSFQPFHGSAIWLCLLHAWATGDHILAGTHQGCPDRGWTLRAQWNGQGGFLLMGKHSLALCCLNGGGRAV